ncbi:hypothetical protein GCM10022255_042670 [Dactylosporangium darangshiense]|uniref:Uncharacterized protein n=1 Tax=Dactylosporangium darangshiense TaxID=579108 RepID=A0ABP8DAL1_9ACTN
MFEDDALIDQLNRALWSMWSRLERLPRSDVFWSHTNHRTTWCKVEDFARRCVDRNPSDETARWALVGLSMHAGSFGGLQLFAEDAAARDEAVHDLIAVAEWVWLEVGVDPGTCLEQALLRVGPPALRLLTQSVGRAAIAASGFLAGKSFAEAIGRRQWDLFVHALVVPTPEQRASSVVSEALLVAGEQRLAAARECLNYDASAVVDLLDAAQWWAANRGTDVMCRLRELLEVVSRDSLERLVGDQGDEVSAPLRTALLVLDGHGLPLRREL